VARLKPDDSGYDKQINHQLTLVCIILSTMLTSIKIQNFAIIDEITLTLEPGMTVVTGETGAGKSLLIDTLSLVLGDRASSNMIKNGTERCTITATFDITGLPDVEQWLVINEFDDHTNHECIIYRSFSKDGRSRSSINGMPCTLQAAKDLGNLLVDIHGQHEHHSLLKSEIQRHLLDVYANNENLVVKIKQLYSTWQKIQKEFIALSEYSHEHSSKMDWLNYQLQELATTVVNTQELEKIQQEHSLLSNSENLINNCHTILDLTIENENNNIVKQLHLVKNNLGKIRAKDARIENVYQLTESAIINVTESISELRHYLEHIELSQERLEQLTAQLQNIYDLARKHKTKPEELPNIYANLQEQLKLLATSDQKLQQLATQITDCENEYHQIASQLSQTRQKAACNLNQLVTDKMQQLGMPDGKFNVKIINNNNDNGNDDGNTYSIGGKITPYGFENIEFQVSTNAGQPPQSLSKVTSGGELSRISLALQVILADKATTPTLIFDEVDVGIGGKIAEIVGTLLHELSNKNQVICVTHLPQVASRGEHHLQVDKYVAINATTSIEATANNNDNSYNSEDHHQTQWQEKQTKLKITKLKSTERIQEIARMLGGINITQRTLDHAQEMLEH